MTIDEDVRLQDLNAVLNRGNHKSAKPNTAFLSDVLRKEIEKVWDLIIPLMESINIPGLVMSPMGGTQQLGVSEEGTFLPKKD